MTQRPLVCVIDDDESVRESLPELLSQLGLNCRAFSSAAEYLASDLIETAACIIADIGMPGMSGRGLQRHLLRNDLRTPMIFMTGQPDECTTVIEAGAVACLAKPFTEQTLLAALATAIPGF